MLGLRWVRVALVVAVAAMSGVLVWLAVRGDGSPTPSEGAADTVDVSAQGLRSLGDALGRPIYWAGAEPGVTYEFTETPARWTYVRYLPAGVPAGSRKAFLTVGTYPVADAFQVTSRVARRPGAVQLRIAGGGVAFYSASRPTNIYVAYPGSDLQIEVYDPSAGAGRALVAAGSIRPLGASPPAPALGRTGAVATTRAGLGRLAVRLHRPIYWLGPISGSTLELTEAADGRVYVRYLPAGVAVGSPNRYLTVATYPVANGLAATRAAARAAGTASIPLRGGGTAFFSRARPTNVYLAFPGVPEQIEVFDPSARQLHEFVAADRVRPVS